VLEKMTLGNWKFEKNIQTFENIGVGKLRERGRHRGEYLKTESV
jgi:hypothetical protein